MRTLFHGLSFALVSSLAAGPGPSTSSFHKGKRDLAAAKAPTEEFPKVLLDLRDPTKSVSWSKLQPQADWIELENANSRWIGDGRKKAPTLFSLVLSKNPQAEKSFLKSFFRFVFCLDGVDADAASGLFIELLRKKPKLVLEVMDDVFEELMKSKDPREVQGLYQGDVDYHQNPYEAFASFIKGAAKDSPRSDLPNDPPGKARAEWTSWRKRLEKDPSRKARLEAVLEVLDEDQEIIFGK